MFLIEIQFNMCYARKHIFPCITHIKLHFCQNTVCFHLAAANRLGISAEVTFAFGREIETFPLSFTTTTIRNVNVSFFYSTTFGNFSALFHMKVFSGNNNVM